MCHEQNVITLHYFLVHLSYMSKIKGTRNMKFLPTVNHNYYTKKVSNNFGLIIEILKHRFFLRFLSNKMLNSSYYNLKINMS